MGHKPVVLVTRPEGQASSLCDQLRHLGFEPRSEPMLELASLESLSEAAIRSINQLDQYDHIIFISGNAVRFGMHWIRPLWPKLPAGPNWFAVGDATAKQLQEQGVPAMGGGPQMTSESLLAHPILQQVAGQAVLIVKGEGGRVSLREELSKRGAEVDDMCCYRRKSPVLATGELAGKLSLWQPQVVLISSGEALENMLALLSPQESTKLTVLPLIVPSARVARIATNRGFTNVRSAANASDAAMLQVAQEWRQTNFSGIGE
ncbi:MAG: uroporphyrinogen-III synthase [Halioglobus sp.]